MPAGQLRDGEVEADDAVHRDNQSRCEPGEYEECGTAAAPGIAGACPSERQNTVNQSLASSRRQITSRRQIRQKSQIPKKRGHYEVCNYGSQVPRQSALEVRPNAHRRGVGNEPIGEPWPAEV